MVFLKLFHLFFLFAWIGSLLFVTRMAAKMVASKVVVSELSTTSGINNSFLKNIYLRAQLPAMIIGICLGISLFILKGINFKGGWLHMKLTMVFFLIIVDILVGRALFSKKNHTSKYFIFLHCGVLLLLFLTLFSIYVLKPL